MNTLFSNLLGRIPQNKLDRNKSDTAAASPPTIEEGSDNTTRHKLILVLLRDVLNRHGIPQQWIELQMLVVRNARRGFSLHIRLALKHWDARLLMYAQAFQNELLADIERFEPNASEWLHGITWQFEMTASCPYTTVPDKAFWQESTHSEVSAAPVLRNTEAGGAAPQLATTPENSTMEDLNQLFFIRDREISSSPDKAKQPEYEKTWPMPL